MYYDKKTVIVLRTRLLILILFGFLNPSYGDHGEHLGGAGAKEGVGTPGTSNSAASGEEQGGSGLSFSFRYEPACASFNPPGTANSVAPFGAGGTGLNDLSCDADYLPIPPPPTQQAGEVGILGQNSEKGPKLVPPKPDTRTPRGETVENPDR